MNEVEIAARYGPQAHDASPFTRKYRLLQSWYRVEVLKEERYGLHEPGGRPVGSAVVNGEATGANFLSLAARALAWEKLAEKQDINPDLTVKRYRLFNNMLSSQPLCFNLFADLRLHLMHKRPIAGAVVAAMLQESPIATVERLDVEVLPQPKEEYIADKTAFDAAVFFTDRQGRPGLASIETKYTDKLGGNKAGREDYQKQIAEEIGLLNDEGRAWYSTHCFDQIMRNLLLTLVCGRRHQMANVRNYVVAPQADKDTPVLIDELRGRLTPGIRDAIALLSLEEVVHRGMAVADRFFADHLREFHRRYLDFSQIQGLLSVS